MITSKIIPLIIPFIISITTAVSLADTIVLKSDQKIQGKIIAEDTKTYLVEVFVTKTIKDEKRIQKSDVKEIIKETKDATAFKEVAKIVPTPDMLSLSDYQTHINTAKDFVSKFPRSSLAPKARNIIKTLEKEHEIVAAGGMKLDGQLIPKPDLEANAYEIDARITFNQLRKQASAGNHRLALLRWETLKDNHFNSASFKQAIPIIKLTLRTYEAQLQHMLNTLDARLQKRDSAIGTMNENDRTRTLAALAEQERNHKALAEKEKNQLKLEWLSVNPHYSDSISHNYKKTTEELKSINNLNPESIKQAGPVYRDTWTSIANNKLEEASENLNKLITIGIPTRYTEPFKTEIAQQQEDRLKAEQKAREAEAQEKAQLEKLKKEEEAKKAAEKPQKKRAKKRSKKTTQAQPLNSSLQ